MGLRHNTADNGFMNTTGVIAGNPGTFPCNVQWSFNGEDARKLRHMPDAWVRPGEVPWAPSYSDPISPLDRMVEAEGLDLRISPLLPAVPIGAPVRVNLELENANGRGVPVPSSLSLKSEHVTGTVVGPHGEARTFRSLLRCIDDEELQDLKPGGVMRHALTLLRGKEGALFPAPGAYTIEVDVSWEIEGVPVRTSGQTCVMVTPAVDDDHAIAALKVLAEPDTLLVLAVGGDHLHEGRTAIDAALADDVLRPHFAVVEAKRLGDRFGGRAANITKALGMIDKDCVLSGAELRRVAEIVQRTKPDTRSRGKVKAVISALSKKVSQVPTDDAVTKMVKAL